MLSFPYRSKYLLLLCLMGSLSACDRSEQQKAEYIEEGARYYKAGDYKKARLAFDNAVAVDPKNVKALYELAERLSKLGDLQDAAKYYQAVVNQDAGHLMARVKLGQIYLLASKPGDAEKMANEALALDAADIDAQVLLGSVLAAQNNTDAAFVKAEAALQKKPDDVGATLLLASLNAKTGKPDKAIAVLSKAVDKHKDNVPMRLMLVNLYTQSRDLEKAESMLEAIVKIEPNVVEHRKRWAVFLINTKQPDKAETVLRRAVAELPEDEQAKLMLVEFLATQKTPEAAIAELIPMVEQNTNNYELRFKLAQLQWAQKQLDKAEDTLKEIVELDKQGLQSAKARNQLARLYMASGRVEQAKAFVKELLAANPEDLATVALRGEIALAENRAPEAIADFRTVLSEQPNNIPLLKLLSAAHLLNKDPVLARENIQKAVELAPGDEAARLDLVNLLLQIGDKEQATQQLNALFKLNPNSKNGLDALFKIYSAQQQWEQALQVAAQFERAYADDATGYYLSGLAYQASGKLEQSTARFEQALHKQAQAVEPLAQLVKNYLSLKQPDKALNRLNEALKSQPRNFFAYNLIGDVERFSNKYAEAVNAYRQAIDIKPAWPVPYRNIALIDIMQKHKNEAIDILIKGIANADEPRELVADLAALYHQDGEHQKVIALYEERSKKNPASLIDLNNLARYLAEYGDNAEALSRAAKLAEPLAKTNNPFMLDTVAWIDYKQGNYDKALKNLLNIVELNPDIALSNYHLGMVYVKQGDKAAAKNYLQKAIDKKTDFNGLTEAKETLKTLEKTAQ